MTTFYLDLLRTLERAVPENQRKKKSALEKSLLGFAGRLKFLSNRRRLKLKTSLTKAKLADAVAALEEVEEARRKYSQEAALLERPEGFSYHEDAYNDAADASPSLAMHTVTLPTHIAQEPAPVGYVFSGLMPGMISSQRRADWLAEECEQVFEELVSRFENYNVLSLDVFDTYLLRGPEAEAARYLELSGFIKDRLEGSPYSKLVEDVSAEALTLMRAEAMSHTYRFRAPRDGCREGSIIDVCRGIAAELGGDSALATLLQEIEVDFEATKLVPNPVLSKLVRHFFDRGGRVILISDMYLHQSHIEAICKKVDPESFGLIERVFSSADMILSKRSGKIFAPVAEELEIDPESIVHIGDSSRSDVEMARLAGWNAMHFPISRPEIIARENSLLELVDHFEKAGIDVSSWAKV